MKKVLVIDTSVLLGDASIVEVVKYYTDLGYEVEIFTGDEGLKAYEPTAEIPRRRRKKTRYFVRGKMAYRDIKKSVCRLRISPYNQGSIHPFVEVYRPL